MDTGEKMAFAIVWAVTLFFAVLITGATVGGCQRQRGWEDVAQGKVVPELKVWGDGSSEWVFHREDVSNKK